jgi:hypothetical protein
MTNWSRGFLAAVALTLAVAGLCAAGVVDSGRAAMVASVALAAMGLTLGAWFLQAFVLNKLPLEGPQRDAGLSDIYTFAYAFTFLSLALLALPFGNLLKADSFPDTGPIRFIRGCVVAPGASDGKGGGQVSPTKSTAATGAAPGAARATQPSPAASAARKNAGRGAAAAAPAASAGAAPAASAASAGAPANPSAPAPAAASAAASSSASTVWPKGLPVCGEDAQDIYTVLVAVGGVVAKATPPSPAASSASDVFSEARHSAIYQVRDGFVISVLMVTLAIVGAAVNLMRRLPEFQKRADTNFIGTEKETPLQPCEAREFVAFQILQLIAAPFIAAVALYVIAPQSFPSAIALAFVSGLFSEGVLLRIRAFVEGPDKTPTQAASQPLGELEISVKSAGAPAAGVVVTVTLAATGTKVNTATTDAQGMAILKSVSIGKLHITGQDPPPGTRVAQPVDIVLAAGQRQHVDLTL